MDLDHIELPPAAIVHLFKNALVAGMEEEAPAPIIEEKKGYSFLGNHRRKITMIVDAPGFAFLPENQLALITKMLEACKMNIGDVAIVNHAVAPVTIAELKKQLMPEILVLFGTTPRDIQLPISFPQFKTQAYDGCTYLFTPPLDELDQNTAEGKLLKSKLWVCLRALFEV